MIGGRMAGSELAPMVGRILISLSGLQILHGYHSFSGVSESLDMEKHAILGFKNILVRQMTSTTIHDFINIAEV
jgi:hypothetical protein